ncbi:MAG: hypothetical protein QXW35_00095 [Candidatus Aenigmatarchaeota archaeon]
MKQETTRRKTLYVFLDECVLVGGLLEKYGKMYSKRSSLEESQKSHIESFNSLKNFHSYLEKELFDSNYKISVKLLSFESSLKNAIKKLEGKEYRKYLDDKKLKEFNEYLKRRKYSQIEKNSIYSELKEYSIRINGIHVNIIREEYEKLYREIFDREHRDLPEKDLKQVFDKDDINYIKIITTYAKIKNGKGIYILFTNDQRIVKKFSIILNRLLKKNVYILDAEALNTLQKYIHHHRRDMSLDYLTDSLRFLSYNYILKSANRNSKDE